MCPACVVMGPLSGSAGWSLPKMFPPALEVALVSPVALQDGWLVQTGFPLSP